ncbi:MAG: GNAT family N-acetyltransferase [Spirochaetaceae bacterium]|nr:GNAT family N-acetyltransferase [Spirochaetaceae bacterium]
MTFDLNDELLQKILFAMENQTEKSAINASTLTVERFDQTPDEDTFFALPTWTSADGFSLLEEFAFNLHNPIVAAELKNVLRSGRGVFRNFKSVIKQYPEIERKWHFFKNKKMIAHVQKWYNTLRESWGLELLDNEIDDTEDLLLSDFVFQPYNSQKDRELVFQAIKTLSASAQYDNDAIQCAISDINIHHFEYGKHKTEIGILCKSISNEFAGCVIGVPCPEDSKTVFYVTAFFVQNQFRGLGIAKELLEQFFTMLQTKNVQQIMFSNVVANENMKKLFTIFGFKKLDFGYLMDFTSE